MIGIKDNTDDFLDGWVKIKGKRKCFLDAIDSLIDWKTIESELNKLYASKGRPSIPPLVVFKMLVIQHFYNLSDPGCEEAVNDSFSFRRFCGLGLADKIPDETTLVRFRKRLVKNELHHKLLELLNDCLRKHGLMVRKVTLVDATLIEASTKGPSKGEKPLEEEASYTVKNKKVHFGYKAHVSTEAATGMIQKVEYTTAKVHDSQVFEQLDTGDVPISADKAYWSKERDEALGNRSYLMIRGRRNNPLNEVETLYNKQVSRIRGRIEKTFGYFKRTLGFRRARYRGICRGLLELQMKSICWNLRRAVSLRG
jgi:IS5 family transposase